MKERMFIVWIEGLSLKNGEKIKSVTNEGFEYTTSMQEALRVKESDVEEFKELMTDYEIADWVINGSHTFCDTNYAKPNTIWRSYRNVVRNNA